MKISQAILKSSKSTLYITPDCPDEVQFPVHLFDDIVPE